jgi:hypothetical protein
VILSTSYVTPIPGTDQLVLTLMDETGPVMSLTLSLAVARAIGYELVIKAEAAQDARRRQHT